MTERQKVTALSSRSDGSRPVVRWQLAGVFVLIFALLLSLLTAAFNPPQRKPGLGVVQAERRTTPAAKPQTTIHAFPDTTGGIHVFSDQLAVWEMSEAQFEFAARHYAGAQKMFASDARRFRSHHPNFVVLNYRLGLGLGYQSTSGDCEPNGVWVEVLEGEKSLREYPENPPEEWFFQWEGQRVLFCDWGWYVMDIANPSWREYWSREVLRQLQASAADGLFVDSLFPPNYLGGDRFRPNLPDMDPAFEASWSARIEDFLAYGQRGELAEYYLIPNVGAWVTGRDVTDYSAADGVMVEGFARWYQGGYFSAEDGDWQMQMDRILHLVNLDKILLLQQLVDPGQVEDRLFLLGSYLLVKGRYTFINFELSGKPEWFPEYEIPIGTPVGGLPRSISSLWRSDWGVYARSYSHGLVLVNPSDKIQEVTLQKTYYRALPSGGGIVPADGDVSQWKVTYVPVTTVKLMPNQAAILLADVPEP